MKKTIVLFSLVICVAGIFSACGGSSSGGVASSGQETTGTLYTVDGNGNILTSPDGINWNIRATGVGLLYGAVQGNNTFVTYETNIRSFASAFFVSHDGVNWTESTPFTFPTIASLIYANGIFVAISPLGGSVLTSPDGVNWTHSATLVSPKSGPDPIDAIAYGNGTFVTVGQYGGIYHSSDAMNWVTVPETFTPLSALTFGNGIFVTAGGNEILTSSDGANWTAETLNLFPYLDILSLAYGNNTFVAVGLSTQEQGTQPISTVMIFASPDGVNWTGGATTIDPSVSVLSYAHGLFFLTGINGTILTSPDGTTWTSRVSNTTGYINAVTYLNIPS